MLLNQLFVPKILISEGGNLASHKDTGEPMPSWQGIPGQHQAQELDLRVHERSYVVGVLSDLLHAINNLFAQQYKEPLWHENSVQAQKFLSGSSVRFFDKKIPDEEFVRVKPTVGDIDTQAPDKHAGTIKEFLSGLIGKKVGDATFIGFSPGNNQYTSMWQVNLKDLPVKLQIDFEYGEHDPKTGLPTPWQEYSHSSSWDDLSAGIKGVFHKYIDRSLPYAANVSTKYVARVLKKSTKISDQPVTDSDFSFAVSGEGGGGVSRKYVPYNDPNTGEPMVRDGIPVMQLLDPANRQYIKNLSQQFEIFFGKKPTKQDQELKNSFIGTVKLSTKYLDDQQRTELFRRFVSICFEPGSQMITKGDPARDRDIKMAAIDYMIEHLNLPNAQELRKEAIDTAMKYEQAFTAKKPVTKPNPVVEAEQPAVKAQLRKGMPHLKDLKPIDFLDLLDELHDGNGRFTLDNMSLNVKVDGFGGRFGKNSEGKPFMGTSRTEPRYAPGFLKHHQEKGTQDPEILGRAKLFDDLFVEMMNAIKLVDSKLGADFLIDKQISCEVLFLPFATETPDGKLKFVGIHYDKLPTGVQLALVPFHVTNASTGEPLENSDRVIKELRELGQQGSVMFIDNSLVQNETLDVTAVVPPLENLEELKSMLSDPSPGSLQRKRDVAASLEPVKSALEKAIAENPNIVGKDKLGKDYEGIVLNTRLGPVKITSQEQRAVIANKQAAIIAASQARKSAGGAVRTKTAVVTAGSFVGHKGHEQLVNLVLSKAAEVGGDPYVYISPSVGPDDPIPPEMKLATWKKLYPQNANMFHIWQEGGTPVKKIEKELVLPPNSPYKHIILMVGTDRFVGMKKWMDTLSKRMKDPRYPGSHNDVTFDTIETKREEALGGTGISFTQCRQVLESGDEQKALQVWTKAFDVNKLGIGWIKKLMDTARKNMGIQQPQKLPQPAPVAERLLNALIMPQQTEAIEETARMSAAVKLQRAWEREQAKSTASRKRGEEYMAKIKQDVADKNKKPDTSKEIEDESIMGFLAAPKKPVEKKPATSPAEMRKYFEKEKGKNPEKIERGAGGKNVQQVYTRSDEGQNNKEAVRRVQKMLNDKYDANLDIDGILGPLTKKSINQFMPNAKKGLADEPDKTTAVQGKKVKEGKEQFNHELLQKGFHFEQEISGVTYRVSNKKGGSDNITIEALDNKEQSIGFARFWMHQYKDGLESLSTQVRDDWRGKGIATNMYAVMRMLGVNIHPASMQSDDGKKMWSKWNKQGDAQHIKSMNAKMAEGSLEELANTSLKVKEPKDFVNTNDRKQVTYKVMKFKSGKDTYLINFTVKGAPAFGKKSNWNAVNVAFGVKEKQDDYSFGDEMNTDLTAKNKNQFLIYSTVINAIRKFITEYNTEIDEIIMQGAGERQEAMYQRFFQSAGKYFPGWHHDGKHSLVRDVPRQTGKKVREQGVAEGSLNEFAPSVATGGGKKDYGQPNSSRYLGGNKFVVGTTNNYILTATIDKYGLDWDDGWYLDSPGAAHLSDASEGEIPLPISTEQRHSLHDLVTDYLNDRNQADLQKVATYFGHGDDGEMNEQGVAEGDSGAKYRVKSIGKDSKGEYYISPSTGQKIYKKAQVGDHEVPGSKEIKPKVEAMLPTSAFVGSKKNKLGPAGQLKGNMRRPARAGDLVGGAAESVDHYVKIGEGWEKQISNVIKLLEKKQ